jgi:hypothetical protein
MNIYVNEEYESINKCILNVALLQIGVYLSTLVLIVKDISDRKELNSKFPFFKNEKHRLLECDSL